MTCYHPLQAFRLAAGGVAFDQLRHRGEIIGDIQLPCGRCQGCRARRASDWTLRVMHEASLHEANCFVTLTYDDRHLPANGSLEHRDFQLYLKRVRKRDQARYYMCGEYGPLNQRPHYHACLFGIDYRNRLPAGKSKSGQIYYESPELTATWRLGKASVQDLTKETAGYCTKYIMNKALGQNAETHYERITEDGEIIQLKPEYSAMSLKPGIGAEWYAKYKQDVYLHDHAILDGKEQRPPKYYDKLYSRETAADAKLNKDKIEYERQKRAADAYLNNTPERLKVREIVHKAKLKNQTRGDV